MSAWARRCSPRDSRRSRKVATFASSTKRSLRDASRFRGRFQRSPSGLVGGAHRWPRRRTAWRSSDGAPRRLPSHAPVGTRTRRIRRHRACLGNVGRIPSPARWRTSTPLVVADMVVASCGASCSFAVVLGRGRIVVDDVMSATLAFLVAATVSTCLAFTDTILVSPKAPASPRFSFGGSPTSVGIRSSCGV